MRGEVSGVSNFSVRQQKDQFNCGIFALEDARIMSEGIQSGNTDQMFQMVSYRPSREKLQEIREDFMIVLRYYLGYGQSQEGNSESIIDRCKKAIEHAEEEDMRR